MATSISIRRRLMGSQLLIVLFFLLQGLLAAGVYWLVNMQMTADVQRSTQLPRQLMEAVQQIQEVYQHEKNFLSHLSSPEQRERDAKVWAEKSDKVRAALHGIAAGDPQRFKPDEMADLAISMSAADTYAEAVQAVIAKARTGQPRPVVPDVVGPPLPPELAAAASAPASAGATASAPQPALPPIPPLPAAAVGPLPNLADLGEMLRPAKSQLAELTNSLVTMSKTRLQGVQDATQNTTSTLEMALVAGVGVAVMGLGVALWVAFSVPRRVVRGLIPLEDATDAISRGRTETALEPALVAEFDELTFGLERVRKMQRALMMRRRVNPDSDDEAEF